MSEENKDLVKTAHKILKAQGHDIPLGHVYELFARIEGYKDWNTAKSRGLTLGGQFPPLDKGEIKLITHLIKDMKANDDRLRPCKIIELSIEGKAWVRFNSSYTLKSETEITEELVKEAKNQFLIEIENYEALAPVDRRVTAEMITAQGFNEFEMDQIDVEESSQEEEINARLNVSNKVNIPDLTEYHQIAEGLYKRQARIESGFTLVNRDDEE